MKNKIKESVLFVIGGLFALFGLGALYVAAHADHRPVYWIGLGLFGFTVFLIFALITESGQGGRPKDGQNS